MFSTVGYFVVLTITLVASNTQPNIGEYTRDNACIGGSIEVISNPSNLSVRNENCNTKYNKTEWALEPFVRYPDVEEDTFYTLVMIDPDAPNLKDGEYYLHWLLPNVQDGDLKDGDLSKTVNAVATYQGPAPPEGTGDHKYQFLIYKQEKEKVRNKPGLVLSGELPDSKRLGFNLSCWLNEQSRFLNFVGPLTGVQFVSNFGGT